MKKNMAKDSAHTTVHHTVLSFGTFITGNLSTESDMRIDGSVTGDIECKGKLVVGVQGSVTGNVTCMNAEIVGTVKGNIKASESLSFKTSALVKGDIQTYTLAIEPGAQFSGSCEMLSSIQE